jgi:hypothetical protein
MKLLISFLTGAIIAGAGFYFGVYKPALKNRKISVPIENADSISLRGIDDILIDPDEAKRYIQNYKDDHDTATDPKITYSIFFGRDAIRYMGHYFDTAGKNVTGVRIFNIQYNKKIMESQKHEKQQAILFVPEDFNRNILWNEWIKNSATIKSLTLVDALNHGELCPNRCP